MARRAIQPEYYESRKAYYTVCNGKLVLLAAGEEHDPEVKQNAWKRFHEVQFQSRIASEEDQNRLITILDNYMGYVEKTFKSKTFKARKTFLETIIAELGSHKICDLKPYHCLDWIQKHPEWNSNTKRLAKSSLFAAINWARDIGLITKNPFVSGIYKKTGQFTEKSRTKESLVSPEDHSRLLENVGPNFRDFIIFLAYTGCRPSECANIECSYFDPHYWSFDLPNEGEYIHKTARHGKSRTIFVHRDIQDMVEKHKQKYPTGKIFRTEEERFWNEENVKKMFDRYRKKLNLSPKLTAYSYRHTYITDFLRNGGSIAICAQLVGTSPQMIAKHYGHLDGHHLQMQQSASLFQSSLIHRSASENT